MWSSSPKVDYLTYSDASDDGWGGFAVQLGDSAAVGSWSLAEQDQSSTFRELRATRGVLESLAPELKGHEVLHRTDNQNTEHILTVGSGKKELHYEAIQVYKLCQKCNIRFTVEWVPREQNTVADELQMK